MKTQDIPDGIDSYIQKWRGKYKHINYTICFHTSPYMKTGEHPDLYPDEGIWNGYIQIFRNSIPKEFDILIPKIVKYENRKYHKYESLDNIFDFGITYFDLIHDVDSKIIGFEVGNDYCHSWNHGTEMWEVIADVKKAIDNFIDRYPKYKAWSIFNGHWITAKNLEAYNKKQRAK